jgi:hypothetical protein
MARQQGEWWWVEGRKKQERRNDIDRQNIDKKRD